MKLFAFTAFVFLTIYFAGSLSGENILPYSENFSAKNVKGFDAGGRTEWRISGEGEERFIKVIRGMLPLPVGKLENFDLSVDISGEGGICFRNGFKVFFKNNGNVWIRRPGVMLLRWVRETRDITKFHKFRIVCVGKIVRIYVDGNLELECLNYNSNAEYLYLRGPGDFDNISLSEKIPKIQSLAFMPDDSGEDFCEEPYYLKARTEKQKRVKDTAFVYASDSDIILPLQVVNENPESVDVSLNISVDDFDGGQVCAPCEKRMSVPPLSVKKLQLPLGKIKDGFYRVKLFLSAGNKTNGYTFYPLFVGKKEKAAKKGTEFPVGVFLREIVWKPFHTKAYWYGIASILRQYGFNSVVATGGVQREFPEIFQKYGISIIGRTEVSLEYSGVKWLLNSNPGKMKELQSKTAKPVLTYFDAAETATGSASDPLRLWLENKPRIRLLKINAADLDLRKTLGQIRDGFASPWWVILHVTEPGNSTAPDELAAARINMETHMALAFGAKGIFYYSLESTNDETALLDPVSLKVVAWKMDVVSSLAKCISRNSELLLKLSPAPFKVDSSDERVVVLSLRADGKDYVYVINTSLTESLSCTLSGKKLEKVNKVSAIFERSGVAVSYDVKKALIKLKLNKGSAQLLEL